MLASIPPAGRRLVLPDYSASVAAAAAAAESDEDDMEPPDLDEEEEDEHPAWVQCAAEIGGCGRWFSVPKGIRKRALKAPWLCGCAPRCKGCYEQPAGRARPGYGGGGGRGGGGGAAKRAKAR